MATTSEIQTFLQDNPGLTDAQIAAAMDQYGVTPAQMAVATGVSVNEVQGRYEAAGGQTYSTSTGTAAPMSEFERTLQAAVANRDAGIRTLPAATPAPAPAFTSQQIADYIRGLQTQGRDNAFIAAEMDRFGVDPTRVASALTLSAQDVQNLYNQVRPGGLFFTTPTRTTTPTPTRTTTPTPTTTTPLTFDAGVTAALARPTYRDIQFTGQTGIGTITPPTTYQNLALLGSQVAGAPRIIGLDAPETYTGVPAALPRPAANVAPTGFSAQDVLSEMAPIYNAGAITSKKAGGLASLTQRNYDEDENVYRYGIGGFLKKILKPVSKILPFVAPFIPGIGPLGAAALSGTAAAVSGNKGFDLKRGLMTGLTSYGLGRLVQGLGQAGSSPEASPVPQFKAELPAGSGIGDYARGTLDNIQSAFKGATSALTPGAQGAYARDIVGQSFGPGSAGMVLTGTTGTAAIDEAEKFKQQQLALENEEEERRRRYREQAEGIMSRYPIRFAARGGMLDNIDDPRDEIGYGMAGGGMPPRFLSGGGDGMSDSIPAVIANKQPARLADGEFVIPADVVSHLGNGSSKAGAKQLYAMMDRIRKARTGTTKQGREVKPRQFMPV